MQRVLVVDDERTVSDTLALIFQKSGFETRAAYDADSAMMCARAFHPDLLLCDINMPGKSGLILVREIAEELPECRIMILTGLYSNFYIVTEVATQLNLAVTILSKPCPPADLLRTATALLANPWPSDLPHDPRRPGSVPLPNRPASLAS